MNSQIIWIHLKFNPSEILFCMIILFSKECNSREVVIHKKQNKVDNLRCTLIEWREWSQGQCCISEI
ncbi:unnamed protein product [Paramecium octaurelia]|uniref:Uncharacterized protein n=1 Tax=Paramecium octaurelia TaxID=43137 RepID=A0A8S1VLB8_PAROT|nr:unnamed protein product [Paramecium octaurelia]